MKIFSYAIIYPFGVAIISLQVLVRASCSEADATCAEHSGSCSASLDKFLAADVALERRDIFNVISYGHYCGAPSKCVAENIAQGTPNNAPEPCNHIDGACYDHDRCLNARRIENDMANNENGMATGKHTKLGFPLRCPCEFGLIADLVQSGGAIGRLCDEEFYESQAHTELGITEAIVFATPICFSIFQNDCTSDDCNGDLDCQRAVAYCCGIIGHAISPLFGSTNPFASFCS
eukprot:CAMPEP_0172306332 /NCGR_PEP_ID=MMETSP1058-20130122/7417_1 /TAXON_ID=83371 /ORGANISM="Detonula confervacea, Strain CCMP 353" /LENGTH=233 /DNA_ID=CAMNT_0013018173 /DNA_START=446 /DNA_END=1147 /DNA_ORIENTATION=+